MMRIYRLLVLILAVFTITSSLAFKPSDAGEYVVVDENGDRGRMVFRLKQEDEQWFLQAKTVQGEWENVSCETDCALIESSAADNESFLGQAVLAKASVSCMHNQELAFCRLSDELNIHQIYALVVRSNEAPAIIRLQRFIDE